MSPPRGASDETSAPSRTDGPRADAVLSVGAAIIGVVLVFRGLQLGVDPAVVASPGLAPVTFGSLLIVFALVLLVRSVQTLLAGKAGRESRKAPDGRWTSGGGADLGHLRTPAALLAVLVLYVLLLDTLGFLLSTALFSVVVLGMLGWRGVRGMLAGIVLAAASYALFDVALRVPLPRGVLG